MVDSIVVDDIVDDIVVVAWYYNFGISREVEETQ